MTTSTLRPDGTISNTGALTGGATAHAVLSDNSDASYVTVTPAGEFARVNLGTVSLPAGSVVISVTTRARSAPGAASPVRMAVTLSIPLQGDLSDNVYTPSSTTPTTHTFSSSPGPFTQAQIDGLTVSVATSSVGGVTLRYHEVYVDVLYAAKPTAAVSAPSGAVTTTSSPTATWSHTAGSDGGPQSRYRLKLFTAAQYGIGGFDPETSPSTYDSGEVVGAATSEVLGPLANSGTWRVYVKTAQTVNAAPHWSDWAFSAFTTSYTLPTIASVGVTPDATNAKFTVLVTRTVMTPTWVACTVERSDDGGTTWVFVRGATSAVASGTTFTVIDYEAPFGTSVIYRARAEGTVFTGPFVSSSSSSISPTLAWLKDVYDPSLNRAVRIRQFPDPEYGIRQGIHQPIGEAYATVISDVRQAPTGETIFQTRTAIEAAALELLLARPFLLLQQLPTWDQSSPNRFVALAKWREQRLVQKVRPHRHWSVSWIEQEQPPE